MADEKNPIRNISDTALWIAHYRAEETERPDASFHDPLARRLAGERGAQIAAATDASKIGSWPYVARTVLFDRIVMQEVAKGADVVVNLAAGLDTRPYRLDLPADMKWIEVDLPGMIAYKQEMLKGELPRCKLEQISISLTDIQARRELFARIGREGKRVLVVSEGLLIYLSEEEVGSLAADLAVPKSFVRWSFDLASSKLLHMLQKELGKHLNQAGAPLKFGPVAGAAFFEKFGWFPLEMNSALIMARELNRLPFFLKLVSYLPQEARPASSRPWSGICLFEKRA
jgi:methyltransferase (TIGR00027 family)